MSSWFQEVGAPMGYGGNTGVNGGRAGYAPAPPAGPAGGVNDSYGSTGDQYDPFAYTRGSLLTPWEGRFSYEGGSGGSGVAEFRPFEYGEFDYRAKDPGQFQERYNDPGNFVYGDYKSLPDFQAPTEADMKQDPGYQVRLKQGQKALEASKAAQGVLRSGGAAKAMAKYGQEMASQEYGNVYGRRIGEYDRNVAENKHSYGTNRHNAAENWDRNISNQRQAHQIRQNDWMGNANVALEASRHGFDVAQGTYDRNLSLARQKHDDLAQHEQAMASAAAAGSQRDYNRALNEYQMARDEFWTNQDRQYNILDREATRGYGAARDYAGAAADIYTGRGDARASGYMGQANARAGAANNIGGTLGGLALYGASGGGQRPAPGGGSYTGNAGATYYDQDYD